MFQERMGWLLDYRGISPTELSQRSGLSRQYINNLMHGHKINPTLETARALAGALKTTVAFLEGETANPDPWVPEQEVPLALRTYLAECSALQRSVQDMTVEERFSFVLHFARARFPQHFMMVEIAYQLGLSREGLEMILSGKCDISRYTLQAFVEITGVNMAFFATGELL